MNGIIQNDHQHSPGKTRAENKTGDLQFQVLKGISSVEICGKPYTETGQTNNFEGENLLFFAPVENNQTVDLSCVFEGGGWSRN